VQNETEVFLLRSDSEEQFILDDSDTESIHDLSEGNEQVYNNRRSEDRVAGNQFTLIYSD
jgi:hypothetical protein